VSFYPALDYPGAVAVGNIPVGFCRAIWIRRTPTNSAGLFDDGFRLRFLGSDNTAVYGRTVLPAGIASTEAFGSFQFNIIQPVGFSGALGTPQIATIQPAGIFEEAFGDSQIATIQPNGFAGVFGTPIIAGPLNPSGFFEEAFGTGTYAVEGVVYPPSMPSGGAFGTINAYGTGSTFVASGSVPDQSSPLTFSGISVGSNKTLSVLAGYFDGGPDCLTASYNGQPPDFIVSRISGDGTPGGAIYVWYNSGSPLTANVVLTPDGSMDLGFIAAVKVISGGYQSLDATSDNATAGSSTVNVSFATVNDYVYIQVLNVLVLGTSDGAWDGGYVQEGAFGGFGGPPNPVRIVVGRQLAGLNGTYDLNITGLDAGEGSCTLIESLNT
jgi:hypothetical protein